MFRTLADWVWPTLESIFQSRTNSVPSTRLEGEVAKEVYFRLQAAADSELDRMKSIDAKLMAVCSVAPICMTLLLAMVGFITANKPGTFTPTSVLSVTLPACYVSLQFLRALLAAIAGLERRAVLVPTADSVWASADDETYDSYINRACSDLALRLRENRETINDKVSWMAVAHCSYRNAVAGMLFAVVAVGLIIAAEFAFR